MSDPNQDPALARSKLISLLGGDIDQWKFTERALREGRVALHWLRSRDPTEFEIVDYICQLLKDGYPIEQVRFGDPPGSAGVAWVMKNPDGRDTYIKLQIEEQQLKRGIEYFAWVVSCHASVYPKK